MSFGERLLFLLEENGMSQKNLAEELHLAPTTLNGYIREHRQPDYNVLIQLAKYFDVTTDYLLGVTEFRHRAEGPLTAKEEGLVGTYRRLDPEEQDLVYEYAEFYQRGRKKQGGKPLRRMQREEYENN